MLLTATVYSSLHYVEVLQIHTTNSRNIYQIWGVYPEFFNGDGGEDDPETIHNLELFHLPTLTHNSLFINNMYVTPLSSTCFEH